MIRGLEKLVFEKRLKKRVTQLGKETSKVRFVKAFKYMNGGYNQDNDKLFSVEDKMRSNGLKP